ncbi:MAG: hypothetical protein Q9M24_02740 [Mariprofundaceae bacterium]|nr:hypothetical protein [Mariprofundaceae bacterium]
MFDQFQICSKGFQTQPFPNIITGVFVAVWPEEPITFYHFRNKDGVEVDLVLEAGGRQVAGIEIKASATVTAADFRGLRKLKEAAGKHFTTGVVLYDGEATLPFGAGLFAVSVRLLWET